MDIEIDRAATQRLHHFLDCLGQTPGYPQRREKLRRYALGLIGGRAHQRLLHFITDSAWDDHAVRLAAERFALAAITQFALP